ncbi:hypothetical protein [Streptomyces sp. NPDC001985]|uniref:hypothetical protein n=1 Tax=Streptomyces sp. NPDC001985 TaxID=3154406 RepID=UPI0033317B2A
MISDLELIGEDGEPVRRAGSPGRPAPGRDPGGDHDHDRDHDPGEPAGAPRRTPPRAWLWALGGAVAASAVWAGGLWAYTSRAPDLQGYRASGNLCEDAAMPELTSLYGQKTGAEESGREDPAMDRAHCWFSFGGQGNGDPAMEMTGSGSITYTLHKRTDPEPQFDASVAAEELNESEDHELVPVGGLGERAFFVQSVDKDVPSLHVLDGRATISMRISSPRGADGELRPADVARLEPLVKDDMAALMERLQSSGAEEG